MPLLQGQIRVEMLNLELAKDQLTESINKLRDEKAKVLHKITHLKMQCVHEDFLYINPRPDDPTYIYLYKHCGTCGMLVARVPSSDLDNEGLIL